jgi:hypothetical protein
MGFVVNYCGSNSTQGLFCGHSTSIKGLLSMFGSRLPRKSRHSINKVDDLMICWWSESKLQSCSPWAVLDASPKIDMGGFKPESWWCPGWSDPIRWLHGNWKYCIKWQFKLGNHLEILHRHDCFFLRVIRNHQMLIRGQVHHWKSPLDSTVPFLEHPWQHTHPHTPWIVWSNLDHPTAWYPKSVFQIVLWDPNSCVYFSQSWQDLHKQ